MISHRQCRVAGPFAVIAPLDAEGQQPAVGCRIGFVPALGLSLITARTEAIRHQEWMS